MTIKNYILITTLALSVNAFAQAKKVIVHVDLTPAGSFDATSEKMKGDLVKIKDTFKAAKLTVSIDSFKTGIDLRDEHFSKHLNSSKHSKATLTDLVGAAGKAKANLEVNGVKKPIAITYKENDQTVSATFKIKASDFALAKAQYMGVGVNDEVEVKAELPFKKQ